ncbi:MAG: GH25 family lysozyme [Brumimicrobium sp.]|nr:GH25 family lysozyme [Brumimicrobium sp.]
MKTRNLPFILALLFIGVFGYLFLLKKQRLTSTNFNAEIPTGFSGFGIDVSHHQGKINWDILLDTSLTHPDIDFVYLKATEGKDHLDSRWDYNKNSLKDRNVRTGAYHFFNPKKLPLPQALHFMNYWTPSDTDLPPVLDVETEGFSDEDLRHKMLRWLKTVEDSTGMRPIIYTSRHFYENKLRGYFPGYQFWIASYSGNPGIPGDSSIIHWQFSESADLPHHRGIKVDLNVSKIPFRH